MSLRDVIAAMAVPPVFQGPWPRELSKHQSDQHGTPSSLGSPANPALANLKPLFIESGCSTVDGGMAPQEWWEGYRHLVDMAAPVGWPVWAWERLAQDLAWFLRDWGAKAAALGWTTTDLFGCDPNAPRQRLDAMGLLLVLDGAVVEIMSADTATLLQQSGSRTRFYRRSPAGAIPVWMIKGSVDG